MKLKEMLMNAINANSLDEKLKLLDELKKEILNQEGLDYDTVIEYLDKIFKLESSIINEKKYSLQMIKNIICNIEEKKDAIYIKIGTCLNNEVYGVFGKDNTFCLAENCNKLFSRKSYLSDIATDSVLTPLYKKDEYPWMVDGIMNISGVESYIVPSSKLFDKEIDPFFVSKDYIQSVNQSVNGFLDENPRFIEEVFNSKVYKRL